MPVLTFREVAEHFKRVRYAVPFVLDREVRLVVEGAAETARGFIGQEQPGWDPLSPVTLADKERQGFPTPFPLKRTGALAASIGSETESFGREVVGIVGSTDEKAVLHELGTSREPPRPFIGPAMMLAEPVLQRGLGEMAIRALIPGKRL